MLYTRNDKLARDNVFFFFFQCQIDFIGYIPNIYIPATSFLFIQSRVLKGRLNFTRLNIIQTQNDASISRASCALSFIYEFFFFFLPSLSFSHPTVNMEMPFGSWCVHTRACVHIFTCCLCLQSFPAEWRLVPSLPPGCAGCSGAVQRQLFPSCVPFYISKAAPTIIVPG